MLFRLLLLSIGYYLLCLPILLLLFLVDEYGIIIFVLD